MQLLYIFRWASAGLAAAPKPASPRRFLQIAEQPHHSVLIASWPR